MRHAEPHIPRQQDVVIAMTASARLERRLLAALGVVAQLVVEDQEFLPVFERLEQELAALQSRADAVERARRYLPKFS